MKIVLIGTNEALINQCQDIQGLEAKTGDIFSYPFDALITPGNSFAFMDGNFDLAVTNKYGIEVQEHIKNTWIKHCGYLLVGQAVTYRLSNERRIIYAPTMTVPCNINNTWNVYLALKAALYQAKIERSKIVVFPALGCGCGGLSIESFKKQVQAAINDYNSQRRFSSWQEAQDYYFGLI